eukprot:TRINITY_DN3837_c0_g1_i3.p1 TRINITY_DN3837_c0_g1~~TRINITY_DN3837_c0_g1_i3.p1  ORF type:complete len:210 (-),score=53.60 TRINITY_DN3837_c0_g1_i3:176-805(-)
MCEVLEDICCVVGQAALSSLSDSLLAILGEITSEPQTRSDRLLGAYFAVLARFILVDFAFVTQAFRFGEKILHNLIELWLQKFDSLPRVYQRKLCSLALLKFVPTRDFEYLRKCGWILTVVSGIVFELEDDVYVPHFDLNPDKSTWTEKERREFLNLQDPINSIKLRDALRTTLIAAESLHGEPNFQKILTELVDPTILSQVMMIVRSQ